MIEYRTAERSDIPALAEAMKLAYADDPWNEHWTDESAQRRVGAIMSGYEPLAVAAVEGDRVIGAAMGFTDPYADEDIFFVSELFVVPERKQRGIGRALLAFLESELKGRGVSVMQLISIEHNVPFYNRCGVERDNVNVMYKRF